MADPSGMQLQRGSPLQTAVQPARDIVSNQSSADEELEFTKIPPRSTVQLLSTSKAQQGGPKNDAHGNDNHRIPSPRAGVAPILPPGAQGRSSDSKDHSSNVALFRNSSPEVEESASDADLPQSRYSQLKAERRKALAAQPPPPSSFDQTRVTTATPTKARLSSDKGQKLQSSLDSTVRQKKEKGLRRDLGNAYSTPRRTRTFDQDQDAKSSSENIRGDAQSQYMPLVGERVTSSRTATLNPRVSWKVSSVVSSSMQKRLGDTSSTMKLGSVQVDASRVPVKSPSSFAASQSRSVSSSMQKQAERARFQGRMQSLSDAFRISLKDTYDLLFWASCDIELLAECLNSFGRKSSIISPQKEQELKIKIWNAPDDRVLYLEREAKRRGRGLEGSLESALMTLRLKRGDKVVRRRREFLSRGGWPNPQKRINFTFGK
ncbi:hypothetical protein BT69DRAFT_483660 [Atractiella rhizophila]|nr:hypothetical protein BT69DRAFT_483660 [Atractiella rhizophila]